MKIVCKLGVVVVILSPKALTSASASDCVWWYVTSISNWDPITWDATPLKSKVCKPSVSSSQSGSTLAGSGRGKGLTTKSNGITLKQPAAIFVSRIQTCWASAVTLVYTGPISGVPASASDWVK